MITPCDAINLIQPLHVYAKTENWQIERELVDMRTYYVYILFAFMILPKNFISGLLYNTSHKNTKLGMKTAQFLRSPTDS
jgi:hypothetical protein